MTDPMNEIIIIFLTRFSESAKGLRRTRYKSQTVVRLRNNPKYVNIIDRKYQPCNYT